MYTVDRPGSIGPRCNSYDPGVQYQHGNSSMATPSKFEPLVMDTPATNSDIEAQAVEMLRRIGWTAYDWKQVELYARMPPARKVEQMFRIRHGAIKLLEARLRREHPERTSLEIKRMVVDNLHMAAEEQPLG